MLIVTKMTYNPATLPKEGTTAIWHTTSSAYGGPFTYKYNASASTTDYAVYGLYYDDSGETAGSGHNIKVKITSGTGYNTWVDGSSAGFPIGVIENSDGTVSLYDSSDSSGNLMYKFQKPTTADWISGGGGGGSAGSAGSSTTKKCHCNFW